MYLVLLPQVVLEGQGVNTAVTGPAAAMALMMMNLKTGDADVAARFKVKFWTGHASCAAGQQFAVAAASPCAVIHL
jgi:hypothetical protein